MVRSHRFVKKPSSHRILISCFFIVLTLLIGQTTANVKDINDTWILEGLLPLFLLFTLLFVAIIVYSSNMKLITIFTAIYLFTINLIPQLKYFFAYGFFDPLYHYQFIHEMTNIGFVPKTGVYGVQYGSAAGSHIFVSELSILAGFDPLLGYKLFLAIGPIMIPLAIYVVYKKLNMPTDLAKIILVSSIVTSPILYKFTGWASIFPLYFFFIYLVILTICSQSNSRSSWVIVTLVGIRIIISHDVTTFFLLISLLSLLILQFFRKPFEPASTSRRLFTSLVMIFAVLGFAHFIFTSDYNLVTLISLFKDLAKSLLMSEPPGAITYYSAFFQLSILDKFFVLAVRMGKVLLSLFLSVLAPVAIFRIKLQDTDLRRFYYVLAVPATISLLIFLLTQFLRSGLVERGVLYFSAFSPFLVGITIYWLIQPKFQRLRNVLPAVIMLSFILVSFLQFYPYQPVIPKVSTNSASYYVMDMRAANTIYQRSVLYFLNTHNSELTIATDPVTRGLMYAVSNPSINALVIQEDPLDPQGKAQLIIVSFDENALPIVSGRKAIVYFQGVQNATMNKSIIYTNGKSGALLNIGGP